MCNMLSKDKIDRMLNTVSNRMKTLTNNDLKEVYPISLIDIACWEWPQGVGLYGLYKYYLISNKEEILAFLLKWYEQAFQAGISEKNINTTSPMLTLAFLYEKTNDPKYEALILEWIDWIMNPDGLIRTGDETFQHMITGDPNSDEILIDTLFMTLLFLKKAGVLLNRQDCIDEANYQILKHIEYLYDKKAGLFYHGFNFNRNSNYGEVHWGRGNAWYTIGILEYIQEVDLDVSVKRYLLSVYKNQCMALLKHANKTNGLWHTVLDDHTSYIEISASAGFLAGIMTGVRLGILPEEPYKAHITKALNHLVTYIEVDGTVSQVSYGTPIGEDAEFYKNIEITPMTYGQALMLMCLNEALQDYWHQ